MQEITKYFTDSEKNTQDLASNFAKNIELGSMIALVGNLGAGKTVFVRGFARGLGITDIICSPTFSIIREYPCKNSKWMYHMDLYRINDSATALDFGIQEYISRPDAITLIEWPERIYDILPKEIIQVEIKRISDTKREITITK